MNENHDILQTISRAMHVFIRENFPNGLILVAQIISKLGLMVLIFTFFYFFFWFTIQILLKRTFYKKEKFPFITSLYKVRAGVTACRILALMICLTAIPTIFFVDNHPDTVTVITRIVNFLIVIFSANFAYKTLKATEYYYALKHDHYRVIAIRAVSQTARALGVVIFSIIGISILFGIKGSTIFGYISAFTAVFFLIYRDFILGFITGLHVATQRIYKAGDWVSIDKYNLEGTILDISILTSKIQNFDRTISTIPTYDLLNTEVKNYESMKIGNKRRIKKSIIFNTNSFEFVEAELFEKLEKISLISDYMKSMRDKIKLDAPDVKNNENEDLNYRKLTNIGVYRKYVELYLYNNPNIDQTDTILARQLDITPQGMPLEIYCFTLYPDLLDYERIKADIFDHLLVASKAFGLQVMQIQSAK
ncbi:MAG: mechanosensitive ion channel family protein [Bergeyella sp.]